MRRLLPSVRLEPATTTRLLRGGALVVLALLVATCGGEKGMGPGEQPTKLAFSVEPSSTTAGEPIATIRVEARNASNSLVGGYTGAVSVAIASNPAAGTLSGTVTVNAVGGVATFDDLEINKSGIGYALSASASGLAAATSAAFDIDAGPASKLAYSVQPTSSTAGEAIAPALEIEARDAFDNLDPNFTGDITVAITGGTGTAGAALSGTMSVTAVAGVATFDDLSIDKSGTGYTLVVASDALPAGTSAPFDIDAGAATQLAFRVEPSSVTAGAPITPAVEVMAVDALGNTATTFTGDVTVAIAGPAPAPAARPDAAAILSGTTTVAAAGGVAIFDNLIIEEAGSDYELTATAGALAAATSGSFDITVGQAAQLVFAVHPSNAPAGAAIAPAVQVAMQDAVGNTVTGFTGDVSLTIATNPAAGTLSGTTTVAAVAGVATFGDLSIDKTGNGYSLSATGGGFTGASAGFTIAAGTASQLAFTVQPITTTAGATMAVQVSARDALGNTDPGFSGAVTIAITAGTGTAGATLSGTQTRSAVSGVATFNDLSIDMAGSNYSFSASASGVSDGTSASFDITTGVATQLVFSVQPSNAPAGATIAPAVQVTAQDAQGNTATSFTGDVTVAISGGTGTAGAALSGTKTVTAVAGVASFGDLSIDKAGTGYTLTATDGSLIGATSAGFDIAAGSASQLAFTVQPVTTTAGATMAVEVTAQDALGNTDPGFSGAVTIAITAGTGTAGATLSGTQTRSAVSGVATFDDLSIDMAGSNYSFSASASGVSDATSAGFDITIGTAARLVFSVQPSNAPAGTPIAPAVQVTAQDAQGNTATGFTGDVTVAITGGTGTAGATLSGTTRLSAVAGVATFSGLSIDKAGTGYTLTATDGSLIGATSAGFNIDAGTASQLAFTVQPASTTAGDVIAVEVSAQDALGNTDPTFAGDVTLAITEGTGNPDASLSGTQTVSGVGGVATFTDLSIDQSGNGYTLSATATGMPVAGSSAFNISAGAATQLAFTVEPSHTIAAMAISPAVQVSARDAFGNTDTGFTGNVTVAIGANPGGGSLSGTQSQVAVAGVAAFADLSIDKIGAGYTLVASSTGLPDATSAAFDISSGTVTQLAFTTQPVTTVAGAAIAVEVTARDAQNNTVTDFTGDVTVAIATNPAGGTLSGATTVAAVAGVATFTNLSIDKVGSGYALLASFGALNSPLSAAFNITPAAASQLVFTAPPTTATAGDAIAPAIVVTARDAFGNTATGFTGDVTVAITTGTGAGGATLSGTTTVAASGGVATFADLSVDKSGTGYTLDATATGLTTATSAAFDINAAAPSQLVFTEPPTTATAGDAIAPAIAVTARDAFGNTVTSFTGDVTVAITTGTGAGGATLSGTTTVAASGGVATFADLSIDKSGAGYTLDATAASLTAATSAAFDINAAAASQLVFTEPPTTATAGDAIAPPIAVTARDAFGNTATGFTGDVTVAITTGTGAGGATLSGTTTVAASGGVATFADLSIDKSSAGYTLDAAAAGLTAATSAAFDITPAVASQLVFTLQPSDATAGNSTIPAGGVITPAVEVTARDALGNTDLSFADVVTLAIVANPGGGTLYGGTATAVNGVATFPDLSIDRVGSGYTLQATSGALTSPPSNAFEITPGLASQLVFNVQPSVTAVGATITPAVTVTAQDAVGNTATGFGGSVAIAIGTNPGGAILSGTLNRAAVGGVATFNNLRLDQVGIGYTLTASAGSLTPGTSAQFNIIASEPTQLFFVTQPSATTAGDGTVGGVISPAVDVVARDASGQTLTNFMDDVTLTITPGTGSSGAVLRLAGATPVTATAGAGGIATFNDLSIDRSGTGYKLTAEITSGTFVGVTGTSAFFNIDPGAADHLAFTVQPSTANVGVAITPQVEVTVEDVLDNKVTGFTGDVTVAIGNDPSGGTAALGGTPTKPVSQGRATFSDLSINVSQIGYTLVATATGPTAATSDPFDVAPGTANKLVFAQHPSDAAAGTAITPVLEAQNSSGGLLSSFSGNVTLTITAGSGTSGATLMGTKTVAAVNGVATFSDLSIDKKGFGYKLSATASGLSGATSATFAISAGAAAQLDFSTHPTTTTAGQPIAPFEVRLKDAFGNPVVEFTGDVSVAISDNPAGGTLSGTTTVSLTPSDQGIATFSNLSIDKSGTGYRLEASSSGLTPDVSNAFSINAGPAVQLAFTVAPNDVVAGVSISPAVRVSAFDALGNVATGFTDDVTLGIAAGTGPGGATLDGTTTVTPVNGVAIFGSVNVTTAGTGYRLSATAPGLTETTSASFNVTHAAASKLAFSVQPGDTPVNAIINEFSGGVQVTALDEFDNTATSYTGNVTMQIGTNPGAGTLFGTIPRAAVGGIATFDDLKITSAGAGYTLRATASGVTLAESAAFEITP